jgi:hypothetical protein
MRCGLLSLPVLFGVGAIQSWAFMNEAGDRRIAVLPFENQGDGTFVPVHEVSSRRLRLAVRVIAHFGAPLSHGSP